MPRAVEVKSAPLTTDQRVANQAAQVILQSAIRVIQHAGWYHGADSATKFQGKYTLLGAIQFASKQHGSLDTLASSWVLNILRTELKPAFKNMGDYNTARGRTQEDIIDVLTRAVKKIDRHLGH